MLEDTEAHRYRKLVIAQGKIIGAILLGYSLLSPIVKNAITRQVDITSLMDALRAGDWEGLSIVTELVE